MEDAHACVLDLQPLQGDEELKPVDSDLRITYFGVYDGHGGDKVAIYTGEHLHNIVAKQDAFKSGNFEQALKDGFLAIDRAILSGPSPHFLLLPPVQLLIHFPQQTQNTKRRFLAALPRLES